MNIISELESIVRNHKIIGISVSGGLDSTLLAYLLHDINHKLKLGVQFKFFCVDRPDDSFKHAKRIVEYINQRFNVSSPLYIVGDGSLHHTEQVRSGMREAINQYDLDILVTGVTKNPPEKLTKYKYGTYDGPVRVKTQNPKFVNPFWCITKKDTVKIIKDLSLVDIPKIAHTCTVSKTMRCGECWQCCEREWAFNENELIDEGEM